MEQWPIPDVKARRYDPRIDPFQYEKDFQNWLRNAALRFGWLYYHVHNSKMDDAGFPDTVLIKVSGPKRGRLIFVELKTAWRPNPTDKQREWLDSLIECGWDGYEYEHTLEVYVWRVGPKNDDRYVTLEQITEVLQDA